MCAIQDIYTKALFLRGYFSLTSFNDDPQTTKTDVVNFLKEIGV